jgi:hypothetical protein
VKKFYKEHGNNMLIPDEDLALMSNNKVNMQELQSKIEDDKRRKEEKLQVMRQM